MSRGVQAWGLRARVPWVEPGELTYICPHARGLMGKGSPRVCIPLLCRAPHSLARRSDLTENSQGCSLCSHWALTPRWGFQNSGSVSSCILGDRAPLRCSLGPLCLVCSPVAMGQVEGLEFCLESTAGAQVASLGEYHLWGLLPTPRPASPGALLTAQRCSLCVPGGHPSGAKCPWRLCPPWSWDCRPGLDSQASAGTRRGFI